VPKILVISDIHLSPSHGFFWENWSVARDFANEASAQAVIVNGDLCINGPEENEELAFAAYAVSGLAAPVVTLPGNHDVGDEPPGQDQDQLIHEGRMERWLRVFPSDRWIFETGGWILAGVNAQLFGSGLARETEQRRWLEIALKEAAPKPVALFLHKPLFLDGPSDSVLSIACMNPGPRRELLQLISGSTVRLIVSGHLHQYRDRIVDGIRHVWAPSTAFAAPHDLGGDPRCGLLSIDFDEASVTLNVEYPNGLITHDLGAIKGHGRHKFLRDMPDAPPAAGAANRKSD
jgi:3',5'-cyclic AMP phosphodiesterase CpdA